MKPKILKVQKGDSIIITKGPSDKIGLVGRVSFLLENGAMVRLSRDWYIPVLFENMEVTK